MAASYSRWWDNDVGDDPVDRETHSSVAGQSIATRQVPVSSSLRPANLRDPSNSPPVPGTSVVGVSQQAREMSQYSGVAPYETLFSNFQLQAIPVYNFWTADEEENGTGQRGQQELADLPRYIQLSWNEAPDLKDPDQFKRRALAGQMVDARSQFIKLSPFGFGSTQIVGHTVQGIGFTPESLQPSQFRENALKAANGYIATGVIEAIVSAETGALVSPPAPSSNIVDEDDFLQDHVRWAGISFPELNSALWRRRSSAYGMQQSLANVSSSGSEARSLLFDGQFGINPYLPGTNEHALSSEGASGSSISCYSRAASGGRTAPQSRIEELVAPLLDSSDQSGRYQHVKAKLIHTNFTGLLEHGRVRGATEPHHAESTIAIAQNAADLAAFAAAGFQHYSRGMQIPSDRIPDVVKPREYIGYVIEKWEQRDGAYQLADTFYIPGRGYTVFYDVAVRYGSSYRYRIRAVLRWSRPRGIGALGPDPSFSSSPGADIDTLVPNEASYFHSEWGAEWAYAQVIDRSPPNPPDEFRVRPVSAERYIEVTFKLPDNPQRDINRMVIYRKLQDLAGNDLTGWVKLQEFRENLDDQARQGTRVLFSVSSRHAQDDITGTKFDVRSRSKVERFVEYGPTNARFEDHDVQLYGEGSLFRYVYAAACFTRHGERSALSDQIGARLNPGWKRLGEFPLDFISCAGVDLDYDTGMFGTWPERRARSEIMFRPDLAVSAPGRVVFSGQERLARKPLQDASYVVRLESLDNGQHIDLPLDVRVTNLPEQVQTLPYVALVPGTR